MVIGNSEIVFISGDLVDVKTWFADLLHVIDREGQQAILIEVEKIEWDSEHVLLSNE